MTPVRKLRRAWRTAAFGLVVATGVAAVSLVQHHATAAAGPTFGSFPVAEEFSNRCLDVTKPPGGRVSPGDGAQIIMKGCVANADYSRWRWRRVETTFRPEIPAYTVFNVDTGRCLDADLNTLNAVLADPNSPTFIPVTQRLCNDQGNQVWRAFPINSRQDTGDAVTTRFTMTVLRSGAVVPLHPAKTMAEVVPDPAWVAEESANISVMVALGDATQPVFAARTGVSGPGGNGMFIIHFDSPGLACGFNRLGDPVQTNPSTNPLIYRCT